MKYLFFAIALTVSMISDAQEGAEETDVFVRVYNLQNKMIGKGNMISISDAFLQLKGKKGLVMLGLDSIGLIKTNHSNGRNALIGAAIVAPVFALTGAASADSNSDSDGLTLGYTVGQGVAVGALLGAVTGAALGGIANKILKKKPRSFDIDGDKLKWKAFKEAIIGLDDSDEGLFEEQVE